MKKWVKYNKIELLENGEPFYEELIRAFQEARNHIYIETYIYEDDEVGNRIADSLIEAIKRGVYIHLLVDAYGPVNFSQQLQQKLISGGIRLEFFRPRRKIFQLGRTFFRRLHRKIIVVDHSVAFVGGTNIEIAQTDKGGELSKQDYAVSVRGPLVYEIWKFVQLFRFRLKRQWLEYWRLRLKKAPQQEHAGTTKAKLVVRDNWSNRRTIQNTYLSSLRSARSSIFIANAYFFPNRRLLKALMKAAQRGVTVKLLLQGKPDKPIIVNATHGLYKKLIDAGIIIYDYQKKILHGKVAAIDDYWSTVGSFNFDPTSLLINLEANIVINDKTFANNLKRRLEDLMNNDSLKIDRDFQLSLPKWVHFRNWCCYWLLTIFTAVSSFLLVTNSRSRNSNTLKPPPETD